VKITSQIKRVTTSEVGSTRQEYNVAMELVGHTTRDVESSQGDLRKQGTHGPNILRDECEANSHNKIIDLEDPVLTTSVETNTRLLDINNFNCYAKDNTGNNDTHVVLMPRSETIIPIPINAVDVDNKNISILKQEIIKDVYCASVINKVKNGQTLVSIMNISEVEQKLQVQDLDKIRYEPEIEYQTDIINNNEDSETRMQKITNMIRCEHMNLEEKGSIIEICRQYSAIFHLDVDQLTYTTAMEHEIRLPENQILIYRRPYRLPYA